MNYDNTLLERMERRNGKRRPKVDINRTARAARATTRNARHAATADAKHTVDQVMEFPIIGADDPAVMRGDREPDNMLVAALKAEINRARLTRRDMYAFIGTEEGMLFADENSAYNLEYGLRCRATISIDSANRWLNIVGKRLVISFEDLEA